MKLLIANFLFTFFITFIYAKKTPNVVIMFMDDMGYADIGALEPKPTLLLTWTKWQRREENLLTSMLPRQFARHPGQVC